MEFMVPLKKLMIGITHNFVVMIYKTLVQRQYKRFVMNNRFLLLKNIVKTLCLLRIGTTNYSLITIIVVLIQILNEQIELFIE